MTFFTVDMTVRSTYKVKLENARKGRKLWMDDMGEDECSLAAGAQYFARLFPEKCFLEVEDWDIKGIDGPFRNNGTRLEEDGYVRL
jgi:hypothetical protein